MGILKTAIALFSDGGVGQQERLPECAIHDEGEPKTTILAIDDDPIVLETIKSLLGKRGFNVLTSSSAPKGLDMLRYAGVNIRVVVLDYSMPRLNGNETLSFVRQLSPNAKVIGLTAMDLDTVPRTYLNGVDKLLKKPVVATVLIGAVCELLGEEQHASSAIQS